MANIGDTVSIATLEDCKAQVIAARQATSLSDTVLSAMMCLFYKATGGGDPSVWLPAGWTLLQRANNATGYDAMAALHQHSKTIVIVNRGVEGFRSLRDWQQAIKQNFGIWRSTQSVSAVDFYRAVLAEAAGQASSLAITGHSMGGGLSDVQMAVGPLDGAGLAHAGLPRRALGFASAAFRNAAESMAAAVGKPVDPLAHTNIRHVLRREDPVFRYGGSERFGSEEFIASIYQAMLRPVSGRVTTTGFKRDADELDNHKTLNYHAWKTIPELRGDGSAQHIFKTWLKEQYTLRSGARPTPYRPVYKPSVPDEDR